MRTDTAAEPSHQSVWQQWVQRPERLWLRNRIFYVHLWVGAGVGMYVVLMSMTGSLIVFRNGLEKVSWLVPFVEWVVNLHENLSIFPRSSITVLP